MGGIRLEVLICLLAFTLMMPYLSTDCSETENATWPPQIDANWFKYTVDQGQLEQPSIAVDSENHPHITYWDREHERIKYARWTGGEWEHQQVGTGWGSSSIALDDRNRPWIAYLHLPGLNLSGWISDIWKDEYVVSGSRPSLILDSNNMPHISSYGWGVQYTYWNGTEWSTEKASPYLDVHWGQDLAVNSSDSPAVCYTQTANGPLKYAWRTLTGWENATVDDFGSTGSSCSLEFDSSDRPHISYIYWTWDDLKYAFWNGLNWETETVLREGSTGHSSSLELDSQGRPHIAHLDPLDEVLLYSWKDQNGWNTTAVDEISSISSPRAISLTLDASDTPHIAYRSKSEAQIRYASLRPLINESDLGVTLDIDPDTLNLKSKGRWITAYLGAENASVHDLNVSTILLQDSLAPERWDYQDDVLMLKFNRQEFKDTVQVGESVQVKITGKWENGTAFEAYDSIRVIWP